MQPNLNSIKPQLLQPYYLLIQSSYYHCYSTISVRRNSFVCVPTKYYDIIIFIFSLQKIFSPFFLYNIFSSVFSGFSVQKQLYFFT